MIRERNHIFKTMTFLFKLWLKYPGLRFGQLILNTFKDKENLYFIEDDELIKKLKFTYRRGLEDEKMD